MVGTGSRPSVETGCCPLTRGPAISVTAAHASSITTRTRMKTPLTQYTSARRQLRSPSGNEITCGHECTPADNLDNDVGAGVNHAITVRQRKRIEAET